MGLRAGKEQGAERKKGSVMGLKPGAGEQAEKVVQASLEAQ